MILRSATGSSRARESSTLGHVSARHPDHSDRYVLSGSRSLGLVTWDDLAEFTLDGEAAERTWEY